MPRPREDSKCFAVRSLRKTLRHSNDLNAHPGGTIKDFLVEKHLDHFVCNGILRRNFTFWWRWSEPGGEVKYKRVGLNPKKAPKGTRWDEWVRSPFEQNSVTIVRLACMIKCNRQSKDLMDGLVGDHNRGPGGWRVADWRLLRVIEASEDDDRGWWFSGM